jgi:hypothetical protein
MKTVAWLHFLSRQQRQHGKGIFTCTELANVADGSPAVINVELGRLVRQGHIRRYAPGRYGLPEGVAVEELVTSIDPDAYVTGAYALFHHGYITQIPREIECFTRRRHNRSRRRATPFGTLVFICASPRVYSWPQGAVADAAQAVCDLVCVLRRRGLAPRSLYTFRNLDSLEISANLLARYPRTVREEVQRLLA